MQTVIKDTKRIIPAELATKKSCPFVSYVNLFNAFIFSVHELSSLDFKRFSTTMHYSVIPQMILTFINILQILNIYLFMHLKL